MRLILIFIITICVISINAQKYWDTDIGLIKNHFHDYDDGSTHFQSKYESKSIYFSAGFGYEVIDTSGFKIRYELKIYQYGGHFIASDGGLGGGYSVNGETRKTSLSFGFLPFNFSIKNRIEINAGIDVSLMLFEELSGSKYNWSINPGGDSFQELSNEWERFSRFYNIGIKARVAYKIKMRNNYYLLPQYQFYFGLTREFDHFPKKTRSMRHFVGIGIGKSIGNN